jgi:hypothetical protein
MANEQGKSRLFGEGLPGTGGDFIDPNDTEGHGTPAEPQTVRTADQPRPTDSQLDDDTEGHLYRSGPSTSGEFAKRVPSDDPHGER